MLFGYVLGICNRSNPTNNPCISSANLVGCIENNDYGTYYVCLCLGPLGPAVTLAADCSKKKLSSEKLEVSPLM